MIDNKEAISITDGRDVNDFPNIISKLTPNGVIRSPLCPFLLQEKSMPELIPIFTASSP